MTGESDSVSVSLPKTLDDRLERLVEEEVFDSRAEALRYGARLVVREETERKGGNIDPDPPVDDSPPGRAGGGGRSAQE